MTPTDTVHLPGGRTITVTQLLTDAGIDPTERNLHAARLILDVIADALAEEP